MARMKKYIMTILSAAIWITIWHLAAIKINNDILLPRPYDVASSLLTLCKQQDFWITVGYSLGNIAKGFMIAVLCGVLLSFPAYFCNIFRHFIEVPIHVIKATPVASFVILALVWIKSEQLSVLISFLIVMPVIYINTSQGLMNTDKKLLEMAKVFNVSLHLKIKNIYIPSVIPYLLSGCSTGVGLAWKSGIAAEIIGLASHSIGNRLYKAKLYLEMSELFAWSIVIILISILFEKAITLIINFIKKSIEGGQFHDR